ncbi:MAG: hypothetical protein JW785_10600 [Acidimicrobiia bacterium]|nr:hypothetical protein [Acidimicrobiia bacterium]
MASWDELRERLFGTPYEVWHDGIQEGRLDAADPQELRAALPEGLADGDWVAAVAARRLADPSLLPVVTARLGIGGGRFAVEAARTIVALGGDRAAAVSWAVDALGWGAWSDRLDVAMGLRHLPGPGVVEALLAAVEQDPDYLVRYHAAESLLHLGGIAPLDITGHPEVFADLVAGADREPTAEERRQHARAAAALRRLLER